MGLSDYVGKSSKIQWIVIIFPFEIVIWGTLHFQTRPKDTPKTQPCTVLPSEVHETSQLIACVNQLSDLLTSICTFVWVCAIYAHLSANTNASRHLASFAIKFNETLECNFWRPSSQNACCWLAVVRVPLTQLQSRCYIQWEVQIECTTAPWCIRILE
jgi:hypothetical protein